MITWMQKHHRYLVVTIWISVIAFVGAGFVGWGSYSYGTSSNNSVISVEDTVIGIDEFQREYSNEVSRIRKEYPDVTDAQIKSSQIDISILSRLTNRAILLQYAKDKGLIATKDEIKDVLKGTASFQVDGNFDKETYYNYLKAIRVIAKDYEKSLESNIVLQKLLSALDLPVLEDEKKAIQEILSLQDRLEIKFIELSDIKVDVKNDEVKEFWENNKNNYMSKKSFIIASYDIHIPNKEIEESKLKEYYNSHKLSFKKNDGKLKSFDEAKEQVNIALNAKSAKNSALLKRLDLSKGKVAFQKESIVYATDLIYPTGKFTNAKISTVFKPIRVENKFVVFKLVSINEPKVLEYEKAKNDVEKIVLANKKINFLKEKAQKELSSFEGKDIGFVGRDGKIDGLLARESLDFLNFVFNSSSKNGFKIFSSKVVMFRVLEQKLLYDRNNTTLSTVIDNTVVGIKNSLVLQSLITKLKSKYKIVNFYQGR